jgi:hypothetical protein
VITPQDKVLITEVLDKYGPEKVLDVVSRFPQRGSWSNCFLAYLYGKPGKLQNAIVKEDVIAISLDAHIRVAVVMGLTKEQVEHVAGEFDFHYHDFIELVEEWLELNIVKVERPLAVGV